MQDMKKNNKIVFVCRVPGARGFWLLEKRRKVWVLVGWMFLLIRDAWAVVYHQQWVVPTYTLKRCQYYYLISLISTLLTTTWPCQNNVSVYYTVYTEYGIISNLATSPNIRNRFCLPFKSFAKNMRIFYINRNFF